MIRPATLMNTKNGLGSIRQDITQTATPNR